MSDKKYWIWLSRIEGLGSVKINKLLELYKEPKNIWDLRAEELINVEGIGAVLANRICEEKYKKGIDIYLDYMERYKIEIITIQDEKYPNKLRNIYDSPAILYVKGDSSILNNFSISIIGCRQCSEYGRRVAKEISFELAKYNINIVSGMAIGIDTCAHLGCINGKGKTIAVLGSGLDRVYPKENMNLYNEIIRSGGAVISEYIIGTKPDKMNFPARNRIVSGLSNGIVVVEAKEKSGTLITIDFGLEQGKDIFVVPGNITSKNSKGTNELIKQGAKIVTCVKDIIEEYNIN